MRSVAYRAGMGDEGIGVLLVRWAGRMLDGSFTYRTPCLPQIGDVIEVTDPNGTTVRALVNGLELQKRLPIRAAELTNELAGAGIPGY